MDLQDAPFQPSRAIYTHIYMYVHTGCSVGRCNNQAEFTSMHFIIFH